MGMPLNRQRGRVRAPRGGRARENRKFIQAPSPEIWSETISGGEEVLAGKWGGLFFGYLLGKNFRRRDCDHLVPPTRMDAAVCRAEVCYPFGRKHRRHRAVKRREFITLLGGAAATWPLAARAQQATKLPTIGYLGLGTLATESQSVASLVQRLRELGWIEGRTVAIEYRWAEGHPERFAEIATEFVGLKVDVIVTRGGAVLAAKQATSVIPIVFAAAGDPVGGGLVASLARPGGNITGLSVQAPDLAGKRLELLREIFP